MNFYTLSDKGRVRTNNEDYAECLNLQWCGPEGNRLEITGLILADGMGGAAAGEFASKLAVKEIKERLMAQVLVKPPEKMLNDDRTLFLEDWFVEANAAIFKEASRNPDMEGMGTTIVSAIIYKKSMALAHVGDSRCYKFFDGTLSQLTRDHSLVQEFIDAGRITELEAFTHPQRNVITRALGVAETLEVTRKNLILESGDLILLCSDGLCGFVESKAIECLTAKVYNKNGTDLKELANILIKEAYLNGGGDNITVCLYQQP